MRPGRHNAITDVEGILVGHCTRDEPGWLTGVTVIVAPVGTSGGVDVRGGGPGTRETDLLDPRNAVDAIDAVVLSGGSAFGLGTADGVMTELYAGGRGWRVGAPHEVVPIVPAAILFDLGRGGPWGHHPGPTEGAAAFRSARGGPVESGNVGAGTGAQAGGRRGGIGTASAVLPDGTTVGALVAVNAVGSPVDPRTGELLGARFGLEGEFDGIPSVGAAAARELAEATTAQRDLLRAGTATTIGVLATDASLTKAQCQKLAGVAHDGLARAVSPVHTMFDGDTFFALATGSRAAPDPIGLLDLQEAAAHCVSRAIAHALLAATAVDRTADGGISLPDWRSLLGP